MVVVDLITGFLGAGKTTFIHKYLHYLKEQGETVRMIENEFGDVSVDTKLLSEDDCEIEDLAGMCMCCVGKEAFIRVLIESSMTGCDRIIVEPSGVYDVDEFFEIMTLPVIAQRCEIGSILTIADPFGMDYLTEEAKYLSFAQLLASGMVILSKTLEMTEEEIGKSIAALDQLMVERGCQAGLIADVCTKAWDQLEEEDFEEFMDAGYSRFVHDREIFNHSEAFQSTAILGHCIDEEDLKGRIHLLFDSPSCGRVYRIKGYLSDSFGQRYEVNCTTYTHSVLKMDASVKASFEDDVLVVIGQDIMERSIREIFSLK